MVWPAMIGNAAHLTLSLAEPNCRNVQIENLAELDLECWWLPTGAGPGDWLMVICGLSPPIRKKGR